MTAGAGVHNEADGDKPQNAQTTQDHESGRVHGVAGSAHAHTEQTDYACKEKNAGQISLLNVDTVDAENPSSASSPSTPPDRHEGEHPGRQDDEGRPENPVDGDALHDGASEVDAATLPEPDSARNHEEPAMADHPSTIDRAKGMLDFLNTLAPGVAHEEARAAIGAAAAYLHQTFGEAHASTVISEIAAGFMTSSDGFTPAEMPALRLH